MAKQTGRSGGVKCASTLTSYAVILMTCTGLAACGSSWHNPVKTPQEAAADEKACSEDAEEATFARTAQQKVEYGRGTAGALPGMSRGETPMQLQDRARTEDMFTRDFESCMKSKGYYQGKAPS